MNKKWPVSFKITLILQIGWILILLADLLAMALFSTLIFARESSGGDCVEIVGLGFSITTVYPLSSMDDPVESFTSMNAYGLIFGQAILTILNIIQGVGLRKSGKRS